MYEIYLKRNEEKRILGGHSWVYANEVSKIEGKDKNGALASVFSFDGKFIGKGFINHFSKILVRIISRIEDEEIDEEFFVRKIRQANDYRLSLGYKNSYRAVFAEADGLPAFIVDKYGDILSVQFLSLGMDIRKETLVNALVKVFSPRGIYERSDVSVREKENLPLVKGKLYGDFDTVTEIEENGLRMLVDVENGQKTGYYLDQKSNRYAIRRYAKGKTVLDCFCNCGGFSLNAAAAGATRVTALDISERALDDVKKNCELNGIENVETVCGDVFKLIREYKKQNAQFDLVILDPPAFCKSLAEVKDAYKGYKDLNVGGLRLVKSGGFLVTCSCSHYMTAPLFEKMLTEAAESSGRTVRTVEVASQGADHPALLSAEETSYLKFHILNVI